MSPPRLRPALRERLSMNRIWFLTGSQALYGDDVIAQVVSQSQKIAEQLDNASEIPCEVVWKLGALRQLPGLAVRRLMADGHGFGGEGDGKTSVVPRAGTVMGAGLPGGTSFMADCTYHLVPGAQKIVGAHMTEVCPPIAAGSPRSEIHRPGAGRAATEAAGRPRRLAPGARPADRHRGVAHRRRAAPHRPVHRSDQRASVGLRGDDPHRARADRLRHPDPALHSGTALEPGLPPARQRAVTSPPLQREGLRT
jgi:hypothetical protein